jgi:hypothetical protein
MTAVSFTNTLSFLGRVHGHDLAVVDDRDAVAQLIGLEHVVSLAISSFHGQ